MLLCLCIEEGYILLMNDLCMFQQKCLECLGGETKQSLAYTSHGQEESSSLCMLQTLAPGGSFIKHS